jgi:tRNA 2-thiocytidine biosynthesis protein TtcA
MLAEGDRILVGLSGGKDSLTLLVCLSERLRRSPIDYKLLPAYIDPGFKGGFSVELRDYCRQSGYDLRVELSDAGVRAHGPENTENPCFLCSRNRRKRLFEIADRLGCNKLALGHHKDDIIETLFLNMCYAGEISTMLPRQALFDNRFVIIRPLAMVDESLITEYAREMNFPHFQNPCPSAQSSKRREIKDMLDKLYRSNPNIKGNLFRALHHVRREYLPAGGNGSD